jgi:hypothetical protein
MHSNLLVAGDTHGNGRWFNRLFETALAEGCDAIFQLGDFGYWEHQASGVLFLEHINNLAEATEIPVYWIDGNHENHTLLRKRYGPGGKLHSLTPEGFWKIRENVFYVPRGTRWSWAGKSFMGLGGAYSIDKEYRLIMEQNVTRDTHGNLRPGTGSRSAWWPEEELSAEEIEKSLEDLTPLDVLFTHDKPRGSNPAWNRKDYAECYPNQDRVSEVVNALHPKLLMHGHLHYRYDDEIRCGDGTLSTKVVALASDQDEYEDSWIKLILDDDPNDSVQETE